MWGFSYRFAQFMMQRCKPKKRKCTLYSILIITMMYTSHPKGERRPSPAWLKTEFKLSYSVMFPAL
jgi:hypothetical protein